MSLNFRRGLVITIGALTALAGTHLAGNRASAQQFGNLPLKPFSGVIAVRQDVTPNLPKELMRVNIKPRLDQAWKNARSPATAKIVAELGKRRFGGQSLHHIDLALGTRTELLGNAGVVQYVIRGNRLTTKITTPDIAFGIGLGAGADPKFSVDFDVYVTLHVAPSLSKVTVTTATVEVKASRPHGANFTGWLVQAGADVFNFMGGADLRGYLRDQINSQRVDVKGQANSALAPLNSALAKVRSLPNIAMSPPGFENSMMYFRIYSVRPNAGPPNIR